MSTDDTTTTPKNDHPYLTEYFETQLEMVEKNMKDLLNDQEKTLRIALDANFRKKYMDDQHAEMNAKLQPLVEKSFVHHDLDKSGVLSKEESARFFSHFAKETKRFVMGTTKLTMVQSMDQVGQALATQFPSELEDELQISAKMKKVMESSMDFMYAQLDGLLEGLHQEYLKNKEQNDAKAFDVVDTAKDGMLHKEEVMKAMEVGSEQIKKVLEALGFGEATLAAKLSPVMHEVQVKIAQEAMESFAELDDDAMEASGLKSSKLKLFVMHKMHDPRHVRCRVGK
ncbi:unnamed protein product [Amoebophrya sp. A120]|nr:unnamed protein product [Amoebophrya sp. A120]|eukprot:GSA120T00003792001.1